MLTKKVNINPLASVLLVMGQILGAWLSSDVVYIGVATFGNALLQYALGLRGFPVKTYLAVIFAIAWPIAMRAGYACNFEDSWLFLSICLRHPGRGVVAACMATSAILVFSPTVSKDRLSRTMLRLGVNKQMLWVVFVVPTLGQSLLDSTKRSALLNQARYPNDRALVRWFRLKVAMLTSGFVKTLTRHWYSQEAASTRIRVHAEFPVFMASDEVNKYEVLTCAWALVSVLIAILL